LHDATYFKFSGQRLALLIMKVALIRIVSNYTLNYEKDKKITLNGNDAIHVFTYAAGGLHVGFKKHAHE